MTVIAFVVFAASHAALIVLFEKQRKKIDELKKQNIQLLVKVGRYKKLIRQQEAELKMITSDFRK